MDLELAAAPFALDPAVGILVMWAFTVLFAHAAWHKWRELARFTATLAAYRMLPAQLVAVAGYGVALLETLLAALLCVPMARHGAAAAGSLLLVSYAIAIGVNLRRGRRDLDCGCTGPADRRSIAAWMVWRNGLLAMLLLAMVPGWGNRPLEAADGLTILAGFLAAVLVYATIDRLLGQVMPRAAALRRGL